jgi:hypothetical protein
LSLVGESKRWLPWCSHHGSPIVHMMAAIAFGHDFLPSLKDEYTVSWNWSDTSLHGRCLPSCPIFSFWPFFVRVTLCMYNIHVTVWIQKCCG